MLFPIKMLFPIFKLITYELKLNYNVLPALFFIWWQSFLIFSFFNNYLTKLLSHHSTRLFLFEKIKNLMIWQTTCWHHKNLRSVKMTLLLSLLLGKIFGKKKKEKKIERKWLINEFNRPYVYFIIFLYVKI